MKKLITLAKEVAPVAALVLLPIVASAAVTGPGGVQGSTAVPNQTSITSLQDILNSVCTIFGWLFVFLIALAIIFVVVAAFKYLTAGGDPEKVKTAGGVLLYAAIAVGVALLARAIPLIVANFLGATLPASC